MSTEIENCTLEIDQERGVIYVHHPLGFTALRVCGLPTPVPYPDFRQMLDVTLKFSRPYFSWVEGEKP